MPRGIAGRNKHQIAEVGVIMKGDFEIHIKFDGTWLLAGKKKNVDSSFIPHVMDMMVIDMAKDFQKVLDTGEIPERIKAGDATHNGGLDFD